jgi:predicted  nucleic acid-binding Zn-ribbon protein
VDAQTADHVANDSASDHGVRCPSCGRVMRRRSIIRLQGRCPP